MAARSKHYDAWGHPIMDMFSMRDYYHRDRESLEVLDKRLPHSYVVIPFIEITFYLNDPKHLYVSRVFPGGSDTREYFVSERALTGLRKAFCGKKPGWKKEVVGGRVKITRTGRLFAPRSTRFTA